MLRYACGMNNTLSKRLIQKLFFFIRPRWFHLLYKYRTTIGIGTILL